MDYRKLIEELKKYTYWLGRDEPCSHDIHPVICDEAAAAIEALLAELDAAVADLKSARSCKSCAFGMGNHPECDDCLMTFDRKNWTWRGSKKGNT